MDEIVQLEGSQVHFLDKILFYSADKPDFETGWMGVSEKIFMSHDQDDMNTLMGLGLIERHWHGIDKTGDAIGYIVITDRGRQALRDPENQKRLQEHRKEIDRQIAQYERNLRWRRGR